MIDEALIKEAAAKVQPLFKHHGWTWHSGAAKHGIPTEAEIIRILRDMWRRVESDPDNLACRTGRLCIERKQGEIGPYIRISLELGETREETTVE